MFTDEGAENLAGAGKILLRGSATVGNRLTVGVFDSDGIGNAPIRYQWQQFLNNTWEIVPNATNKTLTIDTSLLNKQVRARAIYAGADNTVKTVFSNRVTVATLNPIVLENQKVGTRNWEITHQARNNEIAAYAAAASVNRGESLQFKVSLARIGQYTIDFYRLGYYGGTGGRFIVTSGLLHGSTQSSPTINPNTRLVECNWSTSYTLQVGDDWTSGIYIGKLTDLRTGKESQVWFAVRNDDRPSDIGFQAGFTTYQAYNNYGGYSLYNYNSCGSQGAGAFPLGLQLVRRLLCQKSSGGNGQRAYAVSFDRPFKSINLEAFNNILTWEYNMVRWLESQGYDVSYYTNLDVHANPIQIYSQNIFLSVGHDEYWSMEMFTSVEQARDNGINLVFLSANTAHWRIRFEPSSTGAANRVMVCYKQDWELDPLAKVDPSQATTLFRSHELNRPENSLLGVMYVGDYGSLGGNMVYKGADFVVTNASDPYYAHTGIQDGETLSGLVGYEWDAVVNNGFTPSGLVVLSQSPVQQVGELPPLPPDTNVNITNAVRYTASSSAKVFSCGSIQWIWGLDSDTVTNPREDIRAKQIAVNIFADMGAKPQTPSAGLILNIR